MAKTVLEQLWDDFEDSETHEDFYHAFKRSFAYYKCKEKEQIQRAFLEGMNNSVDYFDPESKTTEYENYYNNTYLNKQHD